jgi:probable phosphoglycerate mutase
VAKKKLNLILIRHGLTDWNEQGRLLGRQPIALNERGRAQAERAAEALRDHAIQAVFSSPQKRTVETAEAVARRHGLPVQSEEAIDEVWLGHWQGKLVSELRGDPDLEKYIEDPTFVCDAIEPAVKVQERVVGFAERLRETHGEGNLVLVSHGDPLRLLLVHYLAMDLPLFRRLEVGNGSISTLRFTPRGPRVILLNGGQPLKF